MAREPARKWTQMNIRESLTIEENAGAYAKLQAKDVRRRKKESRYVNDGSGRCHVFLVSARESQRKSDVDGRIVYVSGM